MNHKYPGTAVSLDDETYAMLMRAVDRLEARHAKRMTSGQVVKEVLTQWFEKWPHLTDEK